MTSVNSLIIFAIITIAINSETSECARILGIFPLAGRSHAILGEQLMKTLSRKGHRVDVISHFPLKKPISNYTDLSLEGSSQTFTFTNNLTHSMVDKLSDTSMQEILGLTAFPTCEFLKHPILQNIIKNPPTNPPYDLVIIEYFTAHCYCAFGQLLKVPMIGLTSSVILEWHNEPLGNPSSPAFVPGGFTRFSTEMNFWQRLQNLFSTKFIAYEFNKMALRQQKYVDENFGPGYPSIYELSKKMDLVFVNSHYSLNGIRPFTPGVVEIGGLHIENNKELIAPEIQKWLDESEHGCIYFSFGSMVKIESFPKESLQVFYAAFKNIAPVRVLMKIAKKEELPSGLPKNVKTYHWLPQIQILKHKNVKGFVTHGGLLGTLESISYGVPMIGFPLFGDQHYNMRNYEQKKIAIAFDYKNITEKKFTKALNEILKNPEIRSNIQKMSQLYYDRPLSPQNTAVFWVEYIIKHGSILRSPATNLEWFQVELLDIYGFLLFITLVFFYITFLIIKVLFKCAFKTKNLDKDGLLYKKKK